MVAVFPAWQDRDVCGDVGYDVAERDNMTHGRGLLNAIVCDTIAFADSPNRSDRSRLSYSKGETLWDCFHS
jgi:hypothetical protein